MMEGIIHSMGWILKNKQPVSCDTFIEPNR